MIKTYKYRMYPTNKQIESIDNQSSPGGAFGIGLFLGVTENFTFMRTSRAGRKIIGRPDISLPTGVGTSH